MKEPKTLLEAIQYFSDEQVCIEAVAAMRWPDKLPLCPSCHQAEGAYYLKTQKRWKCKACRHQFSVKVNTIFEDSPISLQKWLPALWQLVNCKNGVSSHELGRSLGVTQKTAWFMLHRLRLALKSNFAPEDKLGGPGGTEADEAFFGPTPKNMHKGRRLKVQQIRSAVRNNDHKGFVGKTAVQGILDREARKIRARVVPDVDRVTLQGEIMKNVKYGTPVYTDQAVAYDDLKYRYIHDTVNHSTEYVKGQVHTNGLENFWSLMKRHLAGTYVAVEPFHLDRYLDEQVFRFNNRATKDNPLNDSDRFMLALSQVANKRLTYDELTGKTGA